MKNTCRKIVFLILPLFFFGCVLRIERLLLDKYRKILLAGATESVNVKNVTGDDTLVWTSSDASVATVDNNGVIHGVNPGNAIVTASTGVGYSKSCYVTVVSTIPQNIILFIGDGMGSGAIKAAGIYENGSPGTLSFEAFSHMNRMSTNSASLLVTDSAAAATALATGRKVYNNVISEAIPGDGRYLETLVEFLKGLGKRTGLVTTSTITDATPAAFGAHTHFRHHVSKIVSDYLTGSRPNLLFGGGGNGANGLSVAQSEAAGYHTVTNKTDFLALVPDSYEFYSAQFGTTKLPYMYDDSTTYPQLSEMTEKALALLETGSNGFFLMIEGGRIDHAGGVHDLARNISETLEFEDAVNSALAWMSGRSDTLIIVTADHETGGLKVLANNGAGVLPTVSWTASGHTTARVPIFSTGTDQDILFGEFDNTYLHDLISDFYE